MTRRILVPAIIAFLAAVQAPAKSASPITPAKSASPIAAPMAPAKMAVTPQARALPLGDVRLTGGPLKHAQDLDAEYLLALEPDRMMAFLRKAAGLQPKAEGYGGWDGSGRQLTGHIAGHYLSAVSLMWAATGDPRFKARADYLVAELKAVQDAQGDGYIGAQLDKDGVAAKTLFQALAKGTIKSGGFDLNGLWSPWYVLHKIYAGLRDAYRYTGNGAALNVEIKYGAWAEGILAGLTDAQLQQMLATEFGGMNEVTADLYADTGDKRWLALSDRFTHRAILDPLARREDILAGKHGNTQVPKLLGALVRHLYTGNEAEGTAASFFWDEVALHHSFATGGHGRNEYFGPPDELDGMIEGRTAETCNVYNMLKMTRLLFAMRPDIKYADFHERALFNHILGSIDPEGGATCYMVPVGQNVAREYQRMTRDFTCCVGSGMESHALHGDGIYYESGDRLWVNLYAPSTVTWKAAGVRLAMSTTFPEGDTASLVLTGGSPRAFTLALRRPAWAGEGFSVKVNGAPVKAAAAPGGYVELSRTWRRRDRVDLILPKTLRLEPLPGHPARVAFLWGPLVLAGDLGPVPARIRPRDDEEEENAPGAVLPTVPVFVTPDRLAAKWMAPVAGRPGVFKTIGVGRDRDLEFTPFYKLHRRLYGAYWDLLTPDEWHARSAATLAAADAKRQLEAATVAFVQPGRMQAERDFNQQGEGATPVQADGRYGRRATAWMSFDLAVDPQRPMILIVTYRNDERQRRAFDVLVDGANVGTQLVERPSPERQGGFFDVEYAIPPSAVAAKAKVAVRFQAAPGSEVAAVYGIRMIRGK
jgi:DUF1680 family protein